MASRAVSSVPFYLSSPLDARLLRSGQRNLHLCFLFVFFLIFLLCDCVYLSCTCRRFRCPLLHVFHPYLSFSCPFKLCFCKCHCNVSSILFFLFLFPFLLFSFIFCCLVPFWTSYLHVRAARRIHRTIPETDDSPITLGILTLPRAAFWERSLVLCQVALRGAASHKYASMSLKSHTSLLSCRLGFDDTSKRKDNREGSPPVTLT